MNEPYNPEDYSDEHLEADDGWRCLTWEEAADGQLRPDDLEFYSDDDGEWKEAHQRGTTDDLCDITYRTRAPLPSPILAALIKLTT